jgi:hypothetical protein
MPNQHEYQAAAEDLRWRARAYRDAIAWSPRRPAGDFTGPGPVADAIDAGHRLALRALGAAADEIETIAAECDRRAEVCRAYRQDLATYHALPHGIREHARVPVRPATWVDV